MSYNTIKIKKYLDIVEEYEANAGITPGHLIEVMSTGKVRVHATAGGNAMPMFALENELEGEGIADAYVATDQVQCWIPTRGDMVYAILADGENVAVGDWLESAGDGTLRKWAVDSTGDYLNLQIVAQAMEAVDMSGSAGVDPSPRIVVRIV